MTSSTPAKRSPFSRRSFIKGATAASIVSMWPTTPFGAIAGAQDFADPNTSPVLVRLFLRGGFDGLALVPPVGDPDYYDYGEQYRLDFDADGFFGLHPNFAPMFNSFSRSEVTGAHAVATNAAFSGSHFEAFDLADRGNEPVGPGWMAAAAEANGLLLPTQKVTMGFRPDESLFGTRSVSLESVAEVQDASTSFAGVRGSIERMYGGETVPGAYVGERSDQDAVASMLALIDAVEPIEPPSSENYPNSPEAPGLREAAALIKSDVGVAMIAVNSGGINNGARWDTHSGQSSILPGMVGNLADGLAAFRQDLGDHWNRTIVVVHTEFGRSVTRNGVRAGGTQHGIASAMLMMGGAVADGPGSGRILAPGWPGIRGERAAQIGGYGESVLPKAVDIRTPLREVLRKHMLYRNLDQVFPTFDTVANPELGLLEFGADGDSDSDGDVDSSDVKAILDNGVGNEGAGENYVAPRGDLNRDGKTDLLDALLLARQVDDGGAG